MYEVTVVITVILMTVSAVDYVRRAWIRETNPVPATWMLATVMIALSFWMYRESPNHSWTANIGVTTSFANITTILIGVIAANVRNGTLRVAFDRVQQWCLAFGVLIVAFWAVTDQPLIAYTFVQCIGIIAYVATIRRLWNVERSTEPLFLWIAVFCASLCSIYPAWVKHDPFAWIYLARAVPSTALMVILIARIKGKMRAPVHALT